MFVVQFAHIASSVSSIVNAANEKAIAAPKPGLIQGGEENAGQRHQT